VATQPLDVRMDPRLQAEGNVTLADLQKQLDLALGIVQTLSLARQTAAAIEAERASASGARAERLDTVYRKLVNAPGPYPQEMLISQIQYLYGIVTSADFLPNQDAFARFEELRKEVDGYVGALP
jgi:hypothetical protein